MALSLAACGSDDAATTPAAETLVGNTYHTHHTSRNSTGCRPIPQEHLVHSFSGVTATLTANTTLLPTDDIAGGGADTITLSMGATLLVLQ